jgi:hypothetical protein
MLPSRFHLPVPLGSTVVTRFLATTGTLTPALLLPAPGQVSLITERAFPNIPSPTTPCAPVLRRCSLFRAGLASDSLWVAIGGSSDFAHYSQSRQSHKAVSSLYRRPFRPVCSTDYPFVSSCSPRLVAKTQLLSTRGGKHATEGLPPSYARSFSSARARSSRPPPSASRRRNPSTEPDPLAGQVRSTSPMIRE